MDWDRWLTLASVVAGSVSAYFSRANYRRESERVVREEERTWSLEFEDAPPWMALDGARWLPCVIRRARTATPVKILRAELRGPRGARLAPPQRAEIRDTTKDTRTWVPAVAAAGEALASQRFGEPPHYAPRLFVEWPSASRFQTSARLSVRVTYEEISAGRPATKIVITSEQIPLTVQA